MIQVLIKSFLNIKENDTPETARKLGNLIKAYGIRRDMIHINLIPLNPTGGYGGSPSARKAVNAFVDILDQDFGIKATPRVRRGIDIDAGCGQLKAAINKKENELLDITERGVNHLNDQISRTRDSFAKIPSVNSAIGVYEDEEEEFSLESLYSKHIKESNRLKQGTVVQFELIDSVDLDDTNDFDDEEYTNEFELLEAARLIKLVHDSSPSPNSPSIKDTTDGILVGPTTNILDQEALSQSKKRRKKILKNLKAIKNLRELQLSGKTLNSEQLEKLSKENEWQLELESVEHNLQ